jgi:hypothetical protein
MKGNYENEETDTAVEAVRRSAKSRRIKKLFPTFVLLAPRPRE